VDVIFQHIQIFECVKKKICNRVNDKNDNKKSLHQKRNIFFIYWYRYCQTCEWTHRLVLIYKCKKYKREESCKLNKRYLIDLDGLV
jgi:hypothetical protein